MKIKKNTVISWREKFLQCGKNKRVKWYKHLGCFTLSQWKVCILQCSYRFLQIVLDQNNSETEQIRTFFLVAFGSFLLTSRVDCYSIYHYSIAIMIQKCISSWFLISFWNEILQIWAPGIDSHYCILSGILRNSGSWVGSESFTAWINRNRCWP